MNGDLQQPSVRIALVTLGDVHDPGSYSGLPHGLYSSLVDLGFDVSTIRCRLDPRAESALIPALAMAELQLPGHLHGARHAYWLARQRAQDGLLMSGIRGTRGRIAMKAKQGVDAVIQHGTEIDLGPLRVPLVTYEDSTLDAALRVRKYYRHLDRAVDRTLEAARRRTSRIYRRATTTCFTSSWAARSALDDYGVPDDRVRVVGVGRNVDTNAVSRDWSLPVFLWIGREWERKGGPQALAAFERVRTQHPDAELHLVGSHPAVSMPGVTGHGELDLGSADTAPAMARLYSMATCLVLPSLHEPSATVFAEAAAAGIGAIGSQSGGSATIIGDGGIVVPPEDVTALTAAMERFTSEAVARDFGARSSERSSLFTWELVARRLVLASGIQRQPLEDEVTFLSLD